MKKKEQERKEKTPEQPEEKPFEFFNGDEDESGWFDKDSDWDLDGRMP